MAIKPTEVYFRLVENGQRISAKIHEAFREWCRLNALGISTEDMTWRLI